MLCHVKNIIDMKNKIHFYISVNKFTASIRSQIFLNSESNKRKSLPILKMEMGELEMEFAVNIDKNNYSIERLVSVIKSALL